MLKSVKYLIFFLQYLQEKKNNNDFLFKYSIKFLNTKN